MTGSKTVKFDQVFIHEFPIILGDNPAVSRGAPLTIDWKPCAHDVIDMDIFEYLREPERRHRKKMIISNSKRAKILMNAGYTVDQIADSTLAMEEAKRIRAENAVEAAKLDNSSWKNLNILNPNVMFELLSGAAEGTGRTLFLAPNAVLGAGQAAFRGTVKHTGVVVKGTGKVVVGTGKVVVGTGKDVVMGTGKLGKDVVLGTGKLGYNVVTGTGRLTSDVVLGTGKLGYNVVTGTGKLTSDLAVGTVKGTGKVVKGAGKHIGKRMSKMMAFNDSATKEMLQWEEDLGYEDADSILELQQEQRPRALYEGRRSSGDSLGRRSRRNSNDSAGKQYRRGSNDSAGRKSDKRDRKSGSNKGHPAPQRMARRGSANGTVSAQMAYRSSKKEDTSPKPNRRSSTIGVVGGGGALAESFSSFKDIFTGGRGLRRSHSNRTMRRSKSGDEMPEASKRSSLIVTPRDATKTLRTRSKSANATTALAAEEDLAHLEQMDDFLNYVRDGDPNTLNPAIGSAYGASDSDMSYDPSNEDLLKSPPDSPNKMPQTPASPEQALAASAEPVPPVA